MKISSQELNGYFLEVLKPIAFAIVLNFVFELSMFVSFVWAYLIWLGFILYQILLFTGKSYYLPQIEALQIALQKKNDSKAKLESAFNDLYTYTENLKKLKAEGEASLRAYIKNLEGEYKLVQNRIHLLESGEELSRLQWELSRVQETNKSELASSQKQVSRLKEQVSQLENQIAQKTNQVSQLQNELSTLQGEMLAYKEVSDAREITKLKQSFHALLSRGDNPTKLVEVANELQKRGVSPESLCDTAEKMEKWKTLSTQKFVFEQHL